MLAGIESGEAVLVSVISGELSGGGRKLGRSLLEAATFLAISLALLEGVKLIAPSDKDGVDVAFGACDGIGTTLENHVLGSATNPVPGEENLYSMLLLESIAVADECVAGIDRDGLSNFDSHV